MTDPTSLPNFPPPAEVRPLRGRVLDALQDLKFSPDLDTQGDVAFTAGDHKLFVRCLESEKFDIMRTFGQWQISDRIPQDLQTRLNACNDVTLGMNLVKAGIAGGNLILTVEQVIAKKENPKAKVSISVGLLLQAVALWHKNVIVKSGGEVPRAEGDDSTPAEPQPWLSEATVPTTPTTPGAETAPDTVSDIDADVDTNGSANTDRDERGSTDV
ncbi:MAG: hypothetical protein WA903_10940 [Ornithinimicrobium sp.]